MAERKEAKPTPRVVLMEFEVAARAIAEVLSEKGLDALLTQLGVEGADALEDPVSVLIPVTSAAGGPKAVIEEVARVGGRFRAIAKDAFDQGHEVIPPEQQKFDLKPL